MNFSKTKFLPNLYLQNVLTLLTSAVAAQLLTLIFTPLLTRLYSPEAFGFYNAIISYSGILAAFLFFSLELAIARPKSIGNVNRILGLLFVMGGTSAFIIFLSILLELEVYVFLGFDRLFEHKFILFLVITFLGSNLLLNAFITRLGLFSIYAKSQIMFVFIRCCVSIILFYLGVDFFGLIIGFLVGTLVNILYISNKTRVFSYKPQVKLTSLKATALKYKDLIYNNTPANLVNLFIVSFPVFYIFKSFGALEVGLFALAYRMILIPVTLVNKAIGQVLYKELISIKKNVDSVSKLLIKNAVTLSLSLPVFIIIYLYGGEIFEVVFGSKWKQSGEIAALLTPYVYFNFVVSPLSFYFVVFDKNRLFFILNLLFFIILCVGTFLLKFNDIFSFIKFYNFNNMLYYFSILSSIIILQYKRHRINKLTN